MEGSLKDYMGSIQKLSSEELEVGDNVELETSLPNITDVATLPDRLTVVETIYHQCPAEEPFSIEKSYDRVLKTKEQIYLRELKVAEEWEPLEIGWVGTHPSLLYIYNKEGIFPNRIPTTDEVEAAANKIILLSFDKSPEHSWKILPTESHKGYPSTIEGLFIKSCLGICKYTLCLFPE